MTLSDLASLGSFVSALAVLVSLVFLYFQVRKMNQQILQTEKNQQAQIRQSNRATGVEMFLTRIEPSAADAIAKGFAGDPDITETQFGQFNAYAYAHFIFFEDVFFQHKAGLLTDEAFAAPRAGYKAMLATPGVRQFWEDSRYMFPAEYAKFVDDLIAEAPLNVQGRPFDQWKGGVVALKANALKQ